MSNIKKVHGKSRHVSVSIWSMTAMLRDSVVVVVTVVRTRPRAIPLAMITMRKSTHTPNANMADRSVGARDESHASEASEALMFCCDRKVLHRRRSGLFLFRPPYKLLCS